MYNKYNNRRNKYNNRNRNEFPQGMTVMVRDNDVNKALRVLKKKLVKDGFFQELRERTFFESKGTKRRKAKDAATRRYKRKMQKRKVELGY
jgi:small subunit ribosomal protein S21